MIERSPFLPALFLIGTFIFSANPVLGAEEADAAKPSDSEQSQTNSADGVEQLHPKVKLARVHQIKLGRREPPTEEKVAQIKKCIASLADIDSPDYAFSPAINGEAFLPLPGQRHGSKMLLTDHRLKSSAALRTLVEIGPEALPFLLEALGDQTPTKLKVKHESIMGGMWLANELWGNPVNELEQRVLRPPSDSEDIKPIESYAVKVGDVCLDAVGQIVGRSYKAVRYQPTACIVINSPTEDPELREQVRKIWASEQPAQKVLDSLLLDYGTEGIFRGASLDGWHLGTDLQIAATMRLLYYFPKETAPLIAERLRRFDVKETNLPGTPQREAGAAGTRRELANGVRTDWFVDALSWCREPQIREAIQDIFFKTDDPDILVAALSGIEDRETIRKRIQTRLDAIPDKDENSGPYGEGYRLLLGIGKRFGKDASSVFTRYLADADEKRCVSAIGALKGLKGDWCVAILRPLLDDKRPSGYTYGVVLPNSSSTSCIPIRICDLAAWAICHHRSDLEFEQKGDHKHLDEQIRVIREKTAGKGE